MSSRRIMVIGYGNPLRGDDGLGWKVTERLVAAMKESGVVIEAVHQLMPELSELICDLDLVIFVDATTVGKPGNWKCESVRPALTLVPLLGHQFDAPALIAYTRAVFRSCPQALLVSVTAETFACPDRLSPAVENVIPAVVRQIRRQIADFHPEADSECAHSAGF